MLEPEQQSDAVLLPFLRAGDEPTSSSALEQLICQSAHPLIGDIIRNKLRVGHSADRDLTDENAADLISEVTLKLVRRLRELKSDSSNKGIKSFRGYVAVTAYHACDEYLRKKYPKRYSLKNQLRYLLTHREGFAVWGNDEGGLFCGFAEWKNQEQLIRPARLPELLDKQTVFTASTSAKLSLPDLVAAIFNRNGQPLELDGLVSLVADLRQIKDDPSPSISIDDGSTAYADQANSSQQLTPKSTNAASSKGCGQRFASCRPASELRCC